MTYLEEMDPYDGCIKADAAAGKGKELAQKYQSATPFPHVVIDEFMPPSLLERCLAEFPQPETTSNRQFDRDQERAKYNYNPDNLNTYMRHLFYSFNSRPFMRILENITAIKGLIPDPYFLGGGFHEITQGGHLSIHADFNHHKPMNLERRINVLIYMNKDWESNYGGQLELWDNEMTAAVQSIVPLFNRCVIFNTTSNSNHGNPGPVNHPNKISRKSIALYYYTATWTDLKKSHTTQFHVRPNSKDKVDWAVKLRELALDLTPPILARKLTSRKQQTAGE